MKCEDCINFDGRSFCFYYNVDVEEDLFCCNDYEKEEEDDMRLDKFTAKAMSDCQLRIYDNNTKTLLFVITGFEDFSKLKEFLKNYNVCSYEAFYNTIIVLVKERKNV